MATAQTRSFKVGETVHLRARVSKPGTREPDDASVVLTSLRTGSTVVGVVPPEFERQAEGDYLLVIQTVGFEPGQYDVVVTISDGPSKVTIVTDTFVLRPI